MNWHKAHLWNRKQGNAYHPDHGFAFASFDCVKRFSDIITFLEMVAWQFYLFSQFFLKENVRSPVWTCRDPISLILGTRFFLILGTRRWISLILGTRFSILGTWIGSLKHLKKSLVFNLAVPCTDMSAERTIPGKPTLIVFQWKYFTFFLLLMPAHFYFHRHSNESIQTIEILSNPHIKMQTI